MTRVDPTDRAGPPRLDGDAMPGLAGPVRQAPQLRGMLALGVMVLSVLAVGGIVIQRLLSREAPQEKVPDVASAHAAKLRLGDPERGTVPAAAASAPLPGPTSAASAAVARPLPGTRIPAIQPGPEDARPIPVVPDGARRGDATGARRPPMDPQDAPILAGRGAGARAAATEAPVAAADSDPAEARLLKTKAELDKRKQQLEQMLERATASPGPAGPTDPVEEPRRPAPPVATAALLGTLERSATPRSHAQRLMQRTLTVPKGTLIPCALKTRIVTATSGFVGCLVQRDVYGHDGKVLLIERGSHLDGEYRMVAVRPGLTRIPVLWTRVLTPHGVSVDLESPATGALGESGLGGHVDNRWPERIGAALLLSLIEDTVKLAGSGDGGTVVLSSTTERTGTLAEEVLKSTINIPPLLYANPGAVVGVYVARDLDFSGVYSLQPQDRAAAAPSPSTPSIP